MPNREGSNHGGEQAVESEPLNPFRHPIAIPVSLLALTVTAGTITYSYNPKLLAELLDQTGGVDVLKAIVKGLEEIISYAE
jgi:hypothetical protein